MTFSAATTALRGGYQASGESLFAVQASDCVHSSMLHTAKPSSIEPNWRKPGG
jgi:hypothetical protein